MHRTAATLLAIALLTACGGKNKKSPETATETTSELTRAITVKTLPDGLILEEVDLNNDGMAEIFNHYRERENAPRLLLRKDADLNRDGAIDVKSWYDDTGMLELEEMDGDFDGQIDMWDHYQDTNGDGKPERVSSEVDTDFDGRPNIFTFYRDGKVIRKERDTNGDGQIDHWEKFGEDGKVIKSGRDVDFDGQVDERDN